MRQKVLFVFLILVGLLFVLGGKREIYAQVDPNCAYDACDSCNASPGNPGVQWCSGVKLDGNGQKTSERCSDWRTCYGSGIGGCVYTSISCTSCLNGWQFCKGTIPPPEANQGRDCWSMRVCGGTPSPTPVGGGGPQVTPRPTTPVGIQPTPTPVLSITVQVWIDDNGNGRKDTTDENLRREPAAGEAAYKGGADIKLTDRNNAAVGTQKTNTTTGTTRFLPLSANLYIATLLIVPTGYRMSQNSSTSDSVRVGSLNPSENIIFYLVPDTRVVATATPTQVPPSPTGGPACNSACPDNTFCQNAQNGCTNCRGGTCQPPVCGTTCTRPQDCAGARDSCTQCIGGICRQAPSVTPGPACNVACSDDTFCQAAQDGCTVCRGGRCQLVPSVTSGPACNSSCTDNTFCQNAQDGCTVCRGGTCQEPPACGTTCTFPSDCAGARDSCTVCRNGTCQLAPSVTPGPGCNVACPNDAFCSTAGDGCTDCSGGGTCQPPACGTTCTRNDQCAGARDSCTVCRGGTCQLITPTPTIDFNPGMCKCGRTNNNDGIAVSPLLSGQRVTITAWGHVDGADITKAKVQDMTFVFMQDNTRLQWSDPIPARIVEQTATRIVYQAQWTITLPSRIVPNATYRVFANMKCVPITQTALSNFSYRAVLQAQTQDQGFLEALWNFLRGLFGGGSSSIPESSLQTIGGEGVPTPTGGKTLQLGIFYPATITGQTCHSILFQFKVPR